MNVAPRNRKLFLWPAAALLIGALASLNPFYAPEMSPRFGTAAWVADMAVALICWVHPIVARAGVLLAGLFMAIPSFLDAPPLFRGWLMCGMFIPLVLACIPVLAPSVTGFRARLALLCSWDHTRELKRRPRYFAAGSLLQLFVATIVFATALDAVELAPVSGLWRAVRWLAGGVMILVFAEMWTAFHNFLSVWLGITTPLLMEPPFLSTSLGEFWTKRWNPGTSFMFRRLCFEPLGRRSPVSAFFAVFILSGVAHALLFYVAMLQWKIALINGSFFFVQPLFILVERRINIRRWPVAAGRAWALSVLALTSPLFVGPALKLIDTVLSLQSVVLATIFVLASVISMESLFLLAALIACWGDQCQTSNHGVQLGQRHGRAGML